MKHIIFLIFISILNIQIFSQSFETHIEDTANYIYQSASGIYEENNSYRIFLNKYPRDSLDYGNLNYIKLDNTGNIIKDTILFPDIKFNYAKIFKRSNGGYYLSTSHINKTDSLNGRIFKLDSAFNIIDYKNLPYYGDSTFYVNDIVEVENNKIVFLWVQIYSNKSLIHRTIMLKTNEDLDSLKFNDFHFDVRSIVNDTINLRYIATPLVPNDTIFAYISYDLSLDSVQLAPMYLPNIISRFQNTVHLLSNHRKIYSTTSVGSSYYMGIYLFDENMQVLRYHIIESDAYPAECKNLSYINNTEFIYFIGTTNYMAYPEDSNSIILARLDTNLNIDYVHYFHNDRALRPYYIATTSDKGCITIGHIGYMNSSFQEIRGAFIIKFDSLGNLVWSHGLENIQEQVALVYPNPATHTVYVKNGLIKQEANFTLFDLQGRQVFTKALQPFENSFNISALSAGVYIYRIANKEKLWQTGKIVKE